MTDFDQHQTVDRTTWGELENPTGALAGWPEVTVPEALPGKPVILKPNLDDVGPVELGTEEDDFPPLRLVE